VAHSIRDAEVDDELIELMKRRGVCYVPTLTREVSAFVYGDRPEFFDDPFFQRYARESEVARVSDPAFMEEMRGSPAAAGYRSGLNVALTNLKLLSDAGIPIAFGTDAGLPSRS
jgi:hypothetical protein